MSPSPCDIQHVPVAFTLLSHKALENTDGVHIQFQLDGNLFNIPSLQASTKISTQQILVLQYADD